MSILVGERNGAEFGWSYGSERKTKILRLSTFTYVVQINLNYFYPCNFRGEKWHLNTTCLALPPQKNSCSYCATVKGKVDFAKHSYGIIKYQRNENRPNFRKGGEYNDLGQFFSRETKSLGWETGKKCQRMPTKEPLYGLLYHACHLQRPNTAKIESSSNRSFSGI